MMEMYSNAYASLYAYEREDEIAKLMHEKLGLNGKLPAGRNVTSEKARKAAQSGKWADRIKWFPRHWITTPEAAKKIGLSRESAFNALTRMVNHGMIDTKKDDRGRRLWKAKSA